MAEANDNALVEGSAAELAVLDVTDAPGKPGKRRNKHRPKAVDAEVIEVDKSVDVRTDVSMDMCAHR